MANNMVQKEFSIQDKHKKCSKCLEFEMSNPQCSECWKTKGNIAYGQGRFLDSIQDYTMALQLDPNNHVLWSNRSGAYAQLQKFDKALEDAESVIVLKPDWFKSYTRKTTALIGLQYPPKDTYDSVLKAFLVNDKDLKSVCAVFSDVVQYLCASLIKSTKPLRRKEKNNNSATVADIGKTEAMDISPTSPNNVKFKEFYELPFFPLPFGCVLCESNVIFKPITLSCGHTFCEHCVENITASSSLRCPICQAPYLKEEIPITSTLHTFLQNSFSKETQTLQNFYAHISKLDLQTIEDAISKDPKNPLYYICKIELLTQEAQITTALKYLEEVILAIFPYSPKSHFLRAKLEIKQNQFTEAFLSLCKTLLLDKSGCFHSQVQSLICEVTIQEPLPILQQYEKISSLFQELNSTILQLPELKVDLSDLNCSLCFELMYDPVATPCGHMFCRGCVTRALDHGESCPMCRTILVQFNHSRRKRCQMVHLFAKTFFSSEYSDRKSKMNAEWEEMKQNIPIFVCSLLLPTVNCPLHIFEPRYRLMIRRCMESGTKQFGMVTYVEQSPGYCAYGTVANIQSVKMLPDGRSLVDNIGGQRFKIVNPGMKDGYMVAKVEWIEDEQLSPSEEEESKKLAEKLKEKFGGMVKLLQQFGIIQGVRKTDLDHVLSPDSAPDTVGWWALELLPVSQTAKMQFLGSKNLLSRLKSIFTLTEAVETQLSKFQPTN